MSRRRGSWCCHVHWYTWRIHAVDDNGRGFDAWKCRCGSQQIEVDPKPKGDKHK